MTKVDASRIRNFARLPRDVRDEMIAEATDRLKEKTMQLPPQLTPAELLAWRRQHAVTQVALARALGVAMNTVSRWEQGSRPIPPWLGLCLRTLSQIRKLKQATAARG